MAGTPPPHDQPSSTPPPEVPEEFAEAYRAAYERALAEQTTGGRHAETDDHDDAPDGSDAGDEVPDRDRWAYRLPRRSGPPRDAIHREPDAPLPPAGPRRPVPRHLAPVLLVVIALLIVLGAYVVGSMFAASVGD